VRALLRRPELGDRFLMYRNGADWSELRADDPNSGFKDMVGAEYSVKDLRTWHGTVLAAEASRAPIHRWTRRWSSGWKSRWCGRWPTRWETPPPSPARRMSIPDTLRSDYTR